MVRTGNAAIRVAALAVFAALLMALAGCAGQSATYADDAAAGDADASGLAVAESYDQVYSAVVAGMDAANSGASAASADAHADEAAASADEELQAVSAQLASGGSLADVDAQGDLMVSDGNGYTYLCNAGTVYAVKADSGTEYAMASYSLTGLDDLSRWSETAGLYLVGTTLAVVGEVAADTGYAADAEDYALAAYAAPRTVVAFIDVSDPEKLNYLSYTGITGSFAQVMESDGVITVASCQAAVAAAGDDGLWGSLASVGYDVLAKRLALREGDPFSYVPSVVEDGNLTALAANRLYLPESGTAATVATVASVDVASRTCSSSFAAYFPYGETGSVSADGTTMYLSWGSAAVQVQASGSLAGVTSADVAAASAASDGMSVSLLSVSAQEGLVGVPEGLGSGSDASYSVYRTADDGSLQLVGSVTLTAVPATTESGKADVVVAYEDVRMAVSNGLVYLYCSGSDAIPRVVVCDEATMQQIADIPLADQVTLSE